FTLRVQRAAGALQEQVRAFTAGQFTLGANITCHDLSFLCQAVLMYSEEFAFHSYVRKTRNERANGGLKRRRRNFRSAPNNSIRCDDASEDGNRYAGSA